MRRLLVLLFALALSGCATLLPSGEHADGMKPTPPTPVSPTPDEKDGAWRPTGATRASAHELWPRASTLAREWREDARLAYVASSTEPRMAVIADGSAPPTRPAPEHPVDGKHKRWGFGFIGDDKRALLAMNLAANGTLLERHEGWQQERSPYIPDFQPLDAAWLDTARVADALRANATTKPFTEGLQHYVSYSLGPADAGPVRWHVSVESHDRQLNAEVDPGSWTVTRADTWPTYHQPPIPPRPGDYCDVEPQPLECDDPPAERTYHFNGSVTFLQRATFEFPVENPDNWWRLKVIAWINWTGLPVDELEATLIDEDDNYLRNAYGASPLRVVARWGEPGTWKLDMAQLRPQQPMDVQATVRVAYESPYRL